MVIAVSRRAALGLAAAALAFPARARGMDPEQLAAVARRAAGLDQLHALIVARDGDTQFEEAFRGPALDRAVNVKSLSKTIHATVAGAALDRGLIDSVDQPLTDFIAPPPGADPRVARITLDHLLTMRAGLERTSGANYGSWVNSRDWVADALRRPFVDEPGGRFLYSTGSFHLLGAALARASGRSLLDITREWIGEPLGVSVPPWPRDPQGLYTGGNEMALSPRALLRFGEMIRLGGAIDGRRVVSAEWIETSWTPRVRSPFSGDLYGYGWFLSEARGHRVAYARGYGGQMLYLVPSLGLTVVVTSDPNRPARSDGHVGDLNALLADGIIPAAEAAA